MRSSRIQFLWKFSSQHDRSQLTRMSPRFQYVRKYKKKVVDDTHALTGRQAIYDGYVIYVKSYFIRRNSL